MEPTGRQSCSRTWHGRSASRTLLVRLIRFVALLFAMVAAMVQLRYFIDCDEAVQAKVIGWTQTDEFIERMRTPFFNLRQAPGTETIVGRVHNWVIFANGQPVGLISANVKDEPKILLGEEPDDPADYPLLGTTTFVDPNHRDRGYAATAKQAIREHDAAKGVRSFGCVIAADNPSSLKSITNAGYEYVRTKKNADKPDDLYYRLHL